MNPQIGPRQAVYSNPYQTVYQVEARFADCTKTYFVNDYGVRAGVVVVNQGRILLVRQYRLLIDAVAWEIPGGKVDPGEEPIAAAAREVFEETGLKCTRLQPLVFFHPGLDTFHNPTHIFIASEFEDTGAPAMHPGEVEGHAWVPLDQCLEMIFAGTICDSFSMAALFACKLKGDAAEGRAS